MKRFVLAAALLLPVQAGAQTPYNCGMAVLRDVEVVTETFALPTITHVRTGRDRRGRHEEWIETSAGERQEKSYRLEIELDDVVYEAEASANPWNFNPTRLIVNDPIGACVDGKRIVLKRPDGKDFKARIVRAERVGP